MALPIALSSVNLATHLNISLTTPRLFVSFRQASAAKLANVQLSSARHILPQKDAFNSPVCASPLHSTQLAFVQSAAGQARAAAEGRLQFTRLRFAVAFQAFVQSAAGQALPQSEFFRVTRLAGHELGAVPIPSQVVVQSSRAVQAPVQIEISGHWCFARPQLLLHQLERELKVQQQGLCPIFAAAPPRMKPEETKAMHSPPRLMAAAAAAAKQEEALKTRRQDFLCHRDIAVKPA
ncbi:hypothetical protein AK812_SmicGene14032 [Symbiodinium microadriaticum]|uniref:Uncharacterized protein n=1 Tax=Symbiodinium microadriaticum TaxID=2951 RepID=A0A1Q9E6K0_SYMMI|nr:hypothetical protein AK812_SmicGene14032 [Symbiodinium microadriaticum]